MSAGPAGPGCLTPVLAGLGGLAGAYADYRLVAAARLYCDAGAEPGHMFALNLEMILRFVLLPLICAGLAAGATRASSRRGVRVALSVTVVLILVGAVIMVDFALLGTLDGYPGDSGLCGPDNVPPWWPSWLPA